MCGIVGAIAGRNVTPLLLEGLKRLEYRGYDSAGLAVIEPEQTNITRLRTLGKVDQLREALKYQPLRGPVGIAHTRWATHGKPSENNAHPHASHEGQIAVVHNGIIENHALLRQQLESQDYTFVTETDSEVIVHLLHHYSQQETDFTKAIRRTCEQLVGAYALAIINTHTPLTLYAVRSGSPLVIGVGIEEYFVASDPLALLPVTQTFVHLVDGDIATLTCDAMQIFDHEHQRIARPLHLSDMDVETTSKGEYRHYMQKEIFEQPQAARNTIHKHLIHDQINFDRFGNNAITILKNIQSVYICACGSSYHAGLVARHWFESIAHIPCQVEIASEFRYRDAVIPPHALFIALSQSGETADTLSALRSAKQRGFQATMGICNVAGSALTREADLLFLTDAGIEVGVAATKTFTTQLIALLLLSIGFQHMHSPDDPHLYTLIEAITHLPEWIQKALTLDPMIESLSQYFSDKKHAIFLGRGIHEPIAREGALKLKEISYVHAEAYPAGELKHGALALIDKIMPVIVLMPNNTLTKKLESNIEEVQARQGEVFLLMDSSIVYTPQPGTHIISIPSMPEILTPIVYNIILQLLAYHIAVQKGTDVDQPRNLAKSVTVE